MPFDAAPDPDLDELRRRAGIKTTPEYNQLNPEPLMVPMSEADLNAVIAALEEIQRVKEIVSTRQLIGKLKQIVGRAQPKYQAPNPLDDNNPYRQEAVLKSMQGG